MEELIKQAFLHVDVIGPHVQQGHYDLLGPDQEIILPQVWDRVIEPDSAITMVMWPMTDRGPHHVGPGRPGGIPMHGLHAGMRPANGMRPGGMPMPGGRPMRGAPPPPPNIHPGSRPMDPRMGSSAAQVIDPSKRKKDKGSKSSGSFFLFGKPTKK